MPNFTIFISDLHLEPAQPEMLEWLQQVLHNQAKDADALYILGDLFEVWLGDDDQSEFNLRVAEIIKQYANTGVPVYFMRGNRDFLLGQRFCRQAGMRFIPDPTLIDLYGTKTLLMHGDSLCTDDHAHQRFRRLSQNKCFYAMARLLPLSLRRKVARKIRAKSEQHNQQTELTILDVNQQAVERAMQAAGVSQMIHGHTHRPKVHPMQQDQRRIVLGAWHEGAHLLRVDKDGDLYLGGI